MFGISQNSYSQILKYFQTQKDILKVVIFGSRATGNYKNGSDIDIAIWGQNISATKIKADLEELNTPYSYDVIFFDDIEKPELKEHIKIFGKVFYDK